MVAYTLTFSNEKWHSTSEVSDEEYILRESVTPNLALALEQL